MPFVSFSCLITLVRSSSKILNRNGKSGHSCLVPGLSGEASGLPPVSMMLALGFFVDALYQVRKFSSFFFYVYLHLPQIHLASLMHIINGQYICNG